MPNSTPTPLLLTDPGFLFWAPLGTAEPTNTVAGSVFTDSWPVAWINLGATRSGSEFAVSRDVEPIQVAELVDPVSYKTTGRMSKFMFDLANVTLANLKRVLNGGTLSVVSGTGATTLSSYTPPAPGAEVRAMLGYESLDATLRLICYQVFAGGELTVAFKAAQEADYASLPVEFNLEVPSSGIPFKAYTAGVARG